LRGGGVFSPLPPQVKAMPDWVTHRAYLHTTKPTHENCQERSHREHDQ